MTSPNTARIPTNTTSRAGRSTPAADGPRRHPAKDGLQRVDDVGKGQGLPTKGRQARTGRSPGSRNGLRRYRASSSIRAGFPVRRGADRTETLDTPFAAIPPATRQSWAYRHHPTGLTRTCTSPRTHG
nr:hypothetical protein GCM10010200_085070 [Actinomadura rugatobispora]